MSWTEFAHPFLLFSHRVFIFAYENKHYHMYLIDLLFFILMYAVV